MISKFIRAAFQMMLTRVGIKAVPAIARNPQGNSIIVTLNQFKNQLAMFSTH